jgi:hypothetical protein
MPGAAWLDRGAPRKKNVEEECQLSVFSHPPKVRDRPHIAHFHWVLKDERVLSHFRRSSRSVRRRRQDLHTRAFSSPGTAHAEAAEAAIAPNLIWSGSLDLPDNLLPLSGIERRTRLDGDDLLAVGERQFDLAGRSRQRKVERIRIAVAALILARPSDALDENKP